LKDSRHPLGSTIGTIVPVVATWGRHADFRDNQISSAPLVSGDTPPAVAVAPGAEDLARFLSVTQWFGNFTRTFNYSGQTVEDECAFTWTQ
jgi:hypothetical protein